MDQRSIDDYRVVPSAGPGLLARRAGVVLVLPELANSTAESAGRLLDLCMEEASGAARRLLRRVALFLGESDAVDVPGFCVLVASTSQGCRLLAHGNVEVTLPRGESRLSSAGYVTWIEREVADLDGLEVAATGSARGPNSPFGARVDLRVGVVPSGSVVLRAPDAAMGEVPMPTMSQRDDDMMSPSASESKEELTTPLSDDPGLASPVEDAHTVATGAPESAESGPQFESVLLIGAPEVHSEQALDLPLGGESDPHDQRTEVRGIRCSRGHFNDPESAYCAVCGISMVQLTHKYVVAPRPPLGVLIFDDGAVFSVDHDYVLGREPELDHSVASGSARPLTLIDAAASISRVHALLRLDGWRTTLEDRGSANGTFVAEARDSEQWRQLQPGESAVLVTGQRIRLGHRTAVFESHVRQR
jgi:hypothetical protein